MAQRSVDIARRQKNDEFYTQLSDVENELRHYRDHFRGKVVFCNCDDPYESNFFKYFAANFNFLGLKKLIATSYSGSPITGRQLALSEMEGLKPNANEPFVVEITEVPDTNNDGTIDLGDVQFLLKNDANGSRSLEGSGDFRSVESIDYLKQADIVCTNPPFSLFREYIAQLIEHDKKFLIIGSKNTITYKEIFPLIAKNRLWVGTSGFSRDILFIAPSNADLSSKPKSAIRVVNGVTYLRSASVWFTNLDYEARHHELTLYRRYTSADYPKYVNYDAIEVSRVVDIPMDYEGEMGVPITFLDKYNPDQFEIIGSNLTHALPMSQFAPRGSYPQGGPSFYTDNQDGTYKRIYTRLLVRNRKVDKSS